MRQGDEVPSELKVVLEQIYSPDAIEVWWKTYHPFLKDSAEHAWEDKRDDVMQIAQALVDGAYL